LIEVVDPAVRGVNLVGYLDAELGLGEIGRRLAGALEAAHIPFAAIPHSDTPSPRHRAGLVTTTRAPYDTNIVCLNADALCSFANDVGTGLLSGRYSIGVWFWETSVFRDARADVFVDEIWTASEFVRAAIAPHVRVPVELLPIPFPVPLEPELSRAELRLPGGYVFLFLFDFVSAERKNPLGVVDAFRRAFAPDEGPTLVLKSLNGRERSPRQLEELEAAAAGRSDIVVMDRYVTATERDAFVASCDCFVSLHRSEGFGLTMAEAISHGKPVIATGYSGNLEFMDDATSYLVPHRLVDVPRSWWAYAPGAVWADPDLDAAAAAMRHVWEHADEARARGARARECLLERFTVGRTARFLEERLGDARARGAIDARVAQPGARAPILDASRMVAEPPGRALAGDPRRVAPSSLVRRLLRRSLWPEFEEQRRLDSATVDALTALQRSLERLDERVQRLERGAVAAAQPPAAPHRPDRSAETP
jgi:glycosyltransferase involved in cell wall biosynthesis